MWYYCTVSKYATEIPLLEQPFKKLESAGSNLDTCSSFLFIIIVIFTIVVVVVIIIILNYCKADY